MGRMWLGSVGSAVLALASAAVPASAQENPKQNVGTFRPSPQAGDLLGVETSHAPGAWELSGGVWLTWNDKPFKVTDADSGADVQIVSHQLTADLFGSVGLAGVLTLGVDLPVVLSSGGEAAPAELALAQVEGASLGDLRLALRGTIIDAAGEGFGLAVSQEISAPTATGDDFSGDSGVVSTTRVIGDYAAQGFRVAANLGFRGREAVAIIGHEVGNAFVYGAGGVAPVLQNRLELLATLEGSVDAANSPADGDVATLDAMAAARLRLGAFAITAAGGGGLLDGLGSPDFRLSLSLSFLPEPDSDDDDVIDADDRCPSEPGLVATLGCPDRDDDGVADGDDRCPATPGVGARQGCPPDGDGDNIADADDRCPAAAGPATLRGCPDADGDGLPDVDDKCPAEKGDVALGGCLPPDTDGDGLRDPDDTCPDVAGSAARKGCPEPRVDVTPEKLVIREKVFFETGNAILESSSYGLLDEIAATLVAHPELLKVRVEGHTDDIGGRASKMTLSDRRAKTVRTYLIKKGVAPGRLTTQGFGDTKPLDPAATDAARAMNRRVELVILERAE